MPQFLGARRTLLTRPKGGVALVPWTPLKLTGGLWFDPATASTFSFAGSGVASWTDRIQASKFSQSTSSSQPVYGATSGPGGTPALTFDGSRTLAGDAVALAFTNGSPGISAAAVLSFSNVSGTNEFLNASSGAGNTRLGIGCGRDVTGPFTYTGRRLDSDGRSTAPSTVNPAINSTYIYLATYDSLNATVSFRVNGSSAGSSSAFFVSGNFSPTNSTYFFIGGAPTFQGVLSDLVIVPRSFSLTESQQLESYFAQKYGLQSSLPAGHP